MTGLGVIVMAHGTPRSLDDVETFYTRIRRGHPPTAEQLAHLVARYEAIGGTSPLAERTEAQRAAIQAGVESRLGQPIPVVLGQRHAGPFIEDAIASLAEQGVTRAVALVLSPHYSATSVGQYLSRTREAAAKLGLDVIAIEHWHLMPAYVEFLADAVARARADLPARHAVLFSAHSLPEGALEDDPYPTELRQSAELVVEKSGLSPDTEWRLCWQSAARTSEPWRGPDVLEVIRDLGAAGTHEGVVVCAQGFSADHLEVLYDLDIEAQAAASEVGLAFARTRSINADPVVMEGLADLVTGHFHRAEWG